MECLTGVYGAAAFGYKGNPQQKLEKDTRRMKSERIFVNVFIQVNENKVKNMG